MAKTKILVITPKFPYPKTGACEQDRGYGIEDLIRLGYDVRVIAKTKADKVPQGAIESKRLGIPVTAVAYMSREEKKAMAGIISRLARPWTWDGAAYEYYDPKIHEAVRKELDEFKPDVVWFDYTYLWPLYNLVRSRKIPIITRSINFEPVHFLQEDGKSLVNLLKFIPKMVSEYATVWKSNVILSITPREEKIYRRMGARVTNLPLRGLPHLALPGHEIRKGTPLHVFFFGSTYNVQHNRHALEFLLREVIPLVNKKSPGTFSFHVLGAKIPDDVKPLFTGNVRYEGFVDDLNVFLAGMDIAVIPSLMGAGMQQKIFEPLVRGIPTVLSSRGIAEYPFQSPRDYRAATTAEEFADAIVSLKDIQSRKELSEHSAMVSKQIFSGKVIDGIVTAAIESVA